MSRRQLPPQIARSTVTDRPDRETRSRYQLTADSGIDPSDR